jgi:antirestriction protein ArdC
MATTQTEPKQSTAEKVTAKMIALMEQGVKPWRQTWKGGAMKATNLKTGKPYRSMNVMLLTFFNTWGCPYWVTYKQAQELGGSVKKGETGTPCFYWSFVDKKDKDGKLVYDARGVVQKIPFASSFTVFNVMQCEGITLPEQVETTEAQRHETAEKVIATYLATVDAPQFIETLSGKAFYNRMQHSIVVPLRTQFESLGEYYGTTFHEMAHSTGKKLGREFGIFGDDLYSREELVAELTAAMLCIEVGIENTDQNENSAAYLMHWLEKAKENPNYLIKAASEAQKAMDLILCTVFDDEKVPA